MLIYHTQYVTQKKMKKDEEGEPEDEESEEEAWTWYLSTVETLLTHASDNP